jgi:hypothetical protein
MGRRAPTVPTTPRLSLLPFFSFLSFEQLCSMLWGSGNGCRLREVEAGTWVWMLACDVKGTTKGFFEAQGKRVSNRIASSLPYGTRTYRQFPIRYTNNRVVICGKLLASNCILLLASNCVLVCVGDKQSMIAQRRVWNGRNGSRGGPLYPFTRFLSSL